MKNLKILLFALFSFAFLFSSAQKRALVKRSETYYCPMHPEVTAHKPGKCPKCGMDLVRKGEKMYACPMHPDQTSAKPGKCPVCGMKMEKTDKMEKRKGAMAMYTCPMHPEVMKHKAGKCPKCGMELVKKEP